MKQGALRFKYEQEESATGGDCAYAFKLRNT